MCFLKQNHNDVRLFQHQLQVWQVYTVKTIHSIIQKVKKSAIYATDIFYNQWKKFFKKS